MLIVEELESNKTTAIEDLEDNTFERTNPIRFKPYRVFYIMCPFNSNLANNH